MLVDILDMARQNEFEPMSYNLRTGKVGNSILLRAKSESFIRVEAPGIFVLRVYIEGSETHVRI